MRRTAILVLGVLLVPASVLAAGGEGFLAGRQSLQWPRHTIEGYGGGVFTPSAYLINPGEKCPLLSCPAASVYYVGGWFDRSRKEIMGFAVSETFLWGRLEFSYALNRLDLGTLPHATEKVLGNNINEKELHLHHWNLRGLVLPENSWGIPVPAVTLGVHFKYNDGIEEINDRLNVPLNVLGWDRDCGVDYTVTATKSFKFDPVPPFAVSVGMRSSNAVQIGYVGFADHRSETVECNAIMFLTDWLSLSYEYRQKRDVLRPLPGVGVGGVLGGEQDWHGVNLGFRITNNLSADLGVLFLGDLANSSGNGAASIRVTWMF
ncbi:MAG TPA: DUF3034 family protein [Phycisphaerae bacterium]|nr:DUF3034 family protein [Phycisphaerae bacterium]